MSGMPLGKQPAGPPPSAPRLANNSGKPEMPLSKLYGIALTGLTTLFLLGCATPSAPVPPETRVLLPPEEYLEACDIPALPEDARNRDLARAFQDAVASLRECNIDKEALRTWRDSLASPAAAPPASLEPA